MVTVSVHRSYAQENHAWTSQNSNKIMKWALHNVCWIPHCILLTLHAACLLIYGRKQRECLLLMWLRILSSGNFQWRFSKSNLKKMNCLILLVLIHHDKLTDRHTHNVWFLLLLCVQLRMDVLFITALCIFLS